MRSLRKVAAMNLWLGVVGGMSFAAIIMCFVHQRSIHLLEQDVRELKQSVLELSTSGRVNVMTRGKPTLSLVKKDE